MKKIPIEELGKKTPIPLPLRMENFSCYHAFIFIQHLVCAQDIVIELRFMLPIECAEILGKPDYGHHAQSSHLKINDRHSDTKKKKNNAHKIPKINEFFKQCT